MSSKNNQLINQNQSHFLGPEFYALVVYLFLIFFAPQERHEWLNIIRPAFSVAIIIAIFCFFRGSSAQNQTTKKIPLQGPILILFCLSIFIANLLSPFADSVTPPLLINFIKLLILYFLIINVIRTEYALTAIIKVILVFGAFIAIYSFLANRFGWEVAYFRMVSPFGGMGSNSNGFAMLLLGLLPFFTMFFIREPSKLRKLLFGLLILFILMCIIKTRSRMGFLGIILQFGLLGWESRKNILVLILLFIILSIAGFRANDYFWERVDTINESSEVIDSSSPARQNKWRQASFIIQKHPVIGVGLSQFRTAVEHYDLGESEHIVHNAYLEIASESGVISMALFLACLIYTVFMNRYSMHRFLSTHNESMYKITVSLYASITSLGFCLIFLSEQYNSMMFLLLGLSGTVLKLSHDLQLKSPKAFS